MCAVHSPQFQQSAVRCPSMYRPWAPQLNSCHGDQALIPSEYSDDDVESSDPGGHRYGAYLGMPRACACACAWPCWPAPCFPILSLCFFPPKPQVPGSEVEMRLAPAGYVAGKATKRVTSRLGSLQVGGDRGVCAH